MVAVEGCERGPVLLPELFEKIEVDQWLHADLFPFRGQTRRTPHEERGNACERGDTQAQCLEPEDQFQLAHATPDIAGDRRVLAGVAEVELLDGLQCRRKRFVAGRESAGDPKAGDVLARRPGHDRSEHPNRPSRIGHDVPQARARDAFRGLLEELHPVIRSLAAGIDGGP